MGDAATGGKRAGVSATGVHGGYFRPGLPLPVAPGTQHLTLDRVMSSEEHCALRLT